MAAGRHGGYRDYEFGDRDLDRDGSRRRYRETDRDAGRRRDESWHNEVKRREYSSNGHHNNHSNRRGPSPPPLAGSRRGRLSSRIGDREPGEVSSRSGSRSGSEDHGEAPTVKDNGAVESPSKKRKFSPIVWDRDAATKVKEAVKASKLEPVALPIPHFPNEAAVELSVQLISGNPSPMDVDISVVSPQHVDSELEPRHGEDEADEYAAPTRLISTSRWADEGEEDGEVVLDNKEADVASTGDSSGRAHRKKVPTPELGEVVRGDSSGGGASRSSGSADGLSERVEMDGKDTNLMDVDHSDSDGVSCKQISETCSEDNGDQPRTQECVKNRRCIDMLQGCRTVDEFEKKNKINEGTYGVVFRAQNKKTDEVVALKKVKLEKEREGFPLTALREINILLAFHHPSIVDVKEVVVGSKLDQIFMVMEYMEHDLKGVMETMKQPYSQSEVKCLMLQLLEGVQYLHDNWVLHRDLKTSNLLLNNRGELKICDFGLSRQYGSPLKPYTQPVVTLWYRAPELLLGAKEYSTAIDMWSVGCIMAELLAKEPLFPGKTEFDQLDKIFKVLGTPNEQIWPAFASFGRVKVYTKQQFNRLREKFPAPPSFSGRPTLSEAGFDLLNQLLRYDPEKRITAEAALKHPWFQEVPRPKEKVFMPTFPALNERDRQKRVVKSPDPLEEQRLKEMANVGHRGLFG